MKYLFCRNCYQKGGDEIFRGDDFCGGTKEKNSKIVVSGRGGGRRKTVRLRTQR